MAGFPPGVNKSAYKSSAKRCFVVDCVDVTNYKKEMKAQHRPNQGLQIVRKSSGKSMRAFAEAAGVSYGMIQLIEAGKRRITPTLARSISAFTGCDPEGLMAGKATDQQGRSYTKELFVEWQSTEATQEDVEWVADYMSKCVRLLLLSSATDSTGKRHAYHFREVCGHLSKAIEEITARLSLADSLKASLATTATAGEWEKRTLGQARRDYDGLPKWKDVDVASQSDDEQVEVRVTLFPLWQSPYGPWKGKILDKPMRLAEAKIELRLPWRADVVAIICPYHYTLGRIADTDPLVVWGDGGSFRGRAGSAS